MRVLHLHLKSFTAVGGVELINRTISRALHEIAPGEGWTYEVHSFHDPPDVDVSRFFPGHLYTGLAGKKRLLYRTVLAAARSDVVISAHVNLAPVVLLAKFLNPRLRIVQITYGIDVWGKLSLPAVSVLRAADTVLALSRYSRDRMIQDSGISSSKIRLFPMPLDPDLNPPPSVDRERTLGRWGVHPDAEIILTVSRLSAHEQYKGYDRTIRAMPRILSARPNAHYLLVGGGHDSEVSRVERLIAKTGVARHVTLTGYVDDQTLAELYAACDVFVMPSKGEGFGVVFLEALRFGKPVIAGNADGSTDAVMDGKLGMLVDPDDVDAIEAAVVAVLARSVRHELTDPERLAKSVADEFGYPRFRGRLGRVLHDVA